MAATSAPRIEFSAAKSGALRCDAGGRPLHSRYDPSAEASRFLSAVACAAKGRHAGSATSSPDSRSAFILVAPCLDYLGEIILSLHPRARLVRLQADQGFRGHERISGHPTWYPDSGLSLEAFLLSQLEPEDLLNADFLEWEPARAAWPSFFGSAREAWLKTASILNAEAQTWARFGPSWLLNCVRNLAVHQRLPRNDAGAPAPRSSAKSGKALPVIVAASGPSLEAVIPELMEASRNALEEGTGTPFTLICLSSALEAILRSGLFPDAVVTSDPGYWAMRHFDVLPRVFPGGTGKSRRLKVIAPLDAALPSWLGQFADVDFYLPSGPFGEKVAELSGIGFPRCAQGMTVTSFALEYALSLDPRAVGIAGMDLCSFDILSHARPHAFDSIETDSDNRVSPAHSGTWKRETARHPLRMSRGSDAPPLRLSPQLSAYAGEIALRFSGNPRVRVLGPATGLPVIFQAASPASTTVRELLSLSVPPLSADHDRMPSGGPSAEPGSMPSFAAAFSLFRENTLRELETDPEAVLEAGRGAKRDILRMISFPLFGKIMKSAGAERSVAVKAFIERARALERRIDRASGASSLA